VFGPVVNLAARAVKLAAPDELVAAEDAVEAAGARGQPINNERLKGFDADVRLLRVARA